MPISRHGSTGPSAKAAEARPFLQAAFEAAALEMANSKAKATRL
jgi:hypothetical protein